MLRALATLLAALVVALCAPAPPAAALGLPEPSPRPERSSSFTVGFGPHAVIGPADSASIALALAKWGGEHRSAPRDLPDGYLPGVPAPRRSDGDHRLPPPPGEQGRPDAGVPSVLPPSRAPPHDAAPPSPSPALPGSPDQS
ncbi:hypothetical protein SAMN02745673_04220 [Marinactinospora thermotolerans DSM 45154]|uniref:Uncharacterized protein n=1 Tax=Marinactinospora thermotolerans DSM 45154 TaxID=1122192 RepID=A0A1T4SZ65_9ACTN|nr:hypothetical protein SAMN02745673_04220 [Marinactinospora thermotolerans DSM 45154]